MESAAAGTTHSLVKALQAIPSFAPLDEAALLGLAAESANLVWAPGASVFERGSEADGLYIVLSGLVQILDDGGREVAELGPGDFFGEFSLLLGTPHQHDARAAEETELVVVPKEQVEALLASTPELARNIREKLEQRQGENARLSIETT